MKTFFTCYFVVMCYYVGIQAQELRPPPSTPVSEIKPTEDNEYQTFTYVEMMPEFIGGQSEMYKFIGANIYMPDTCRELGVAGRVIVQFVVDSMGYIRNTKVVQNTSIDCGYGEVALQMLERMNHPEPHWIPGRHVGKKVNVRYALPVNFKFKE